MIRFFYNLLFPIGLLLFLPGYLVKMTRRGNYREKFGQRLGFYDDKLRERLNRKRVTWMHAVSVGEVAVALKLAARLKESDAELFCVLTTTTTTGFAFAVKESPNWVEVMYNPIDFWLAMHRAFNVIRPTKLILIEAEIWPNLVAEARRRGVPLALANARLSLRSERRFRKFRFLIAPIFRQLDLVCVPESDDVARWQALGVHKSRIVRTGNIKYDLEEKVRQVFNVSAKERGKLETYATLPIADAALVLFGGSTHAGEEEILTNIFLKLRGEFPSLVLVLAPRHVERVGSLRAQLEKRSLGIALRSESGAKPFDCLLIDTTGELRQLYSVATVAFVGKSLTAHGGQNPVEPIMAGKPVLFGPHMENFASLAALLVRQGGAVQVEDEISLQREIAKLFRYRADRARLVENANQVLAAHRGASTATAHLLAKLHAHA